jgi:hypothetical protein
VRTSLIKVGMPLQIFRLRMVAGANAVGLLLGGSFFARNEIG